MNIHPSIYTIVNSFVFGILILVDIYNSKNMNTKYREKLSWCITCYGRFYVPWWNSKNNPVGFSLGMKPLGQSHFSPSWSPPYQSISTRVLN